MSSVPTPSLSSSSSSILSSASTPTSKVESHSYSYNKISLETPENSFHTLTLRYTPESRVILEDILAHLDNRDAKVKEVVTICETGKIDSDFLLESTFDLYALQAVREGKLSKNQFCTIMAVKAGLEEKDITPASFEEVPLFISGAINPRAWDIFIKTNQLPKKTIKTYLTSYELSDLFLAMGKEGIPTSEQKLYIIPDTRKEFTEFVIGYGNPDFRVSHSLELEAKFSFLITCTIDGRKYRIIPSHTLRQAALNEHYRDKALEMLTVISPSTTADLRNAQMENKRDYAIPVSSAVPGSQHPTPLMADGYHATKLDFEDHDWYHAWTASAIPKAHREVALELSRFFEADRNEFKHKEIFINRSVDLEFSIYRNEIGQGLDVSRSFWMSLDSIITNGIGLATGKNEMLANQEIDNFLKSDLYKKLYTYISENQSEWAKVGITLDGLKKNTEEINQSIINFFRSQGYSEYMCKSIANTIQSNSFLFRLHRDLSKMAT